MVAILLTFLRSKFAIYLGGVLLLCGLAGWAYLAVVASGYDRCENDYKLVAQAAQEEAHQMLLAETARGEALSAELSKTQRKLDETKAEYLRYANAITGNCPAELGVFVNQAAGGNQAGLPKAPSPPTGAASEIAASLIAANVAENYGRANSCISQLEALIKWHEGAAK